ncbi:MAG TPA: hypothetical protein VFZ08_05680 [Terriglobia bacterium]|nr:hypothetical protein [Terriglobia bacterium]
MRATSRAILLVAVLGSTGTIGVAQGRFELVTGKLLSAAVPGDFYMEGNAIPVEKRNAALIKTPAGRRALFALIVTSGFASEIQQKYSGMLISEGPVSMCGKRVAAASYGFGIRRPHAQAHHAEFLLYNQAGERVMACRMERDLRMLEPRPLQVVIESSHSARLYVGRYWLALGP